MKRPTHSLLCKIIAIFLVTITFLFSLFSAIGIAVLAYFGGYVKSFEAIESSIAEKYLYEQTDVVAELFYDSGEDAEVFAASLGETNYEYSISNLDGEILAADYTGGTYLAETERNASAGYRYQNGYGYTPRAEYTVSLHAKEELPVQDELSFLIRLTEFGYRMRFRGIALLAASGLVTLALLVFLYCSAGRRAGSDEPQLNYADKIPFDLYAAFFCAAAALQIAVMSESGSFAAVLILCVCSVLDFLLFLGFTMSFATRVKTGTLFRNTLTFYVCRFFWRLLKKITAKLGYIFRNMGLVLKTVLALGALTFFNFIVVFASDRGTIAGFWLLETAVFIPLILTAAIGFKKLQQGAARFADGKLDEQIDTRKMFWDFKKHGDNLNNISAGITKAVDERMKSERFKTELITNVSHDIKTPLTSIINYVDLIKKENPEEEKIRAYIEVLDRQSARLKKLIEDLVEASKASTGNLAVNMAPCEVNVLLAQTVGEYEEKMQKNGLELVLGESSHPVRVMADGRHLWRVFDNLMNNIIKYAQHNTRVYLSLEESKETAVITFRNISKAPLNISGEELMERFVRGDSSRNTEGSGLGLSIARSLTELQGGEFKLLVDGDLFKVVLCFPTIHS